MSIAALGVTSGNPVFRTQLLRYAWKEYRALRPLWLAVAALAVLMQWMSTWYARGEAESQFAMAWGAAALYVVGAVVTLFSAEREDRTHSFLLQLPGGWQPMFAAKTGVALLSALAMALSLSVAGYAFAGGTFPTSSQVQQCLGIVGVAILEGLAWGLLFSLLLRQPLLAAVLGIAAASLAAQAAVHATASNSAATFTADSYVRAALWRLLLSAAVFAIDLRLASAWLSPIREKTNSSHRSSTRAAAIRESFGARRKLLTRLLWQTWRESWSTMLAVVCISWMLMFAFVLPQGVAPYDWPKPGQWLCLLFLPALFGALVFRADHRRDHRQFLLAQAAPARWVWLVRNGFWLTGLGMVLLVITLIVGSVAGWHAADVANNVLRNEGDVWFEGKRFATDWSQAWELQTAGASALRITLYAWLSSLAAYAVGQLCSLWLRREILAGLLSVLLSMVLSAGALLLLSWEIEPLGVLLPVALGALAAGWLYAPAWLEGRRHVRHFVLPALVVLVPLVVSLSLVPFERREQIRSFDVLIHQGSRQSAIAIYELRGEELAEAEAVALRYEQLAAELSEFTADRDERIDELIELTKVPRCRISLQSAFTKFDQIGDLLVVLQQDAKQLQLRGELDEALTRYLAMLRLERQRLQMQSSNKFKIYLRDGWLYWPASDERHYHSAEPQLVLWATQPGQTSERIKLALNQIENHQQEISIFDLARQAVLADERLVREVLLDRRPPWFMEKGADDLQKLKYLSNQLPGERERSLAALELVTEFTLELLDAISVEIMPGLELGKDDGGAALRSFFSVAPESRLEPAYQFAVRSHSGRSWAKFQMANLATDHCGTSWLLAEELEDYSRLDSFLFTLFEAEIRQRMLLNQLALVAYRLDHGEYPGSLEALVPEYLLALPLDPFSDSPFQYYAKGISPPLWDGGKLYEGGPLLCSLGWRASADAELVRSFEEVPIDPEAELPLGEIRETQLMEVSEFRYGVRINTLPPVIDEP